MKERGKTEILRRMIRIRLVEQFIADHYHEQKMRCPTHLCLGQEAVPAVFGTLAEKSDIFVGTCRSHGYYLGKGGDLTPFFAELLGKPSGCSKGFGGSMHIIDLEKKFWGTSAIVAGGIPIAAGAALSLKYKKLPQVVVAFLGDAAMEEGVVYETANFALLHNLPIIFVCENNKLAINTPIELRQSRTVLFDRFHAMGMRSVYIDENDFNKLTRTAVESYDMARNGLGPSFIEYSVRRWSIHVGHDYEGPANYWHQDYSALEASSCPICVLINGLIKERVIDISILGKLKNEISEEIEAAYKRADEAPAYCDVKLEEFVYSSQLESVLPKTKDGADCLKFELKEQSKLVNPF